MEDVFNAKPEEAGSPEGEWQAGIELARFNSINGLPGYIESVGQLGLRPVALGAQHLEPILHWYRRVPYRFDTPYVRLMSTIR